MIYDPGLIGQRIKSAREDKNLTIKELAELLGLSESTVSRYEAGYVAKIKLPVLSSIAGILDVQEEYLLGVTDKKQSSDDIMPMSDYKYVPTSVAAGSPIEIDGLQDLPTLQLPKAFLGKYSDRKDLILMRVNGESMNKIIRNGSWIAVITKIELDNLKSGDLVVFDRDYEYSLKEYHDLGDEILFRPLSTDLAYKEIRCKKDRDLRIVGKVVMYNITLD
ncbi:DNA-binding helix-turn-helix protein [Peptoniphilus sp. oral taxon 375 str. F0436]|nr:DNA-binding helix-turn-helix protein [Peptoniphilus sp. oral taxon 375 str. F0436]